MTARPTLLSISCTGRCAFARGTPHSPKALLLHARAGKSTQSFDCGGGVKPGNTQSFLRRQHVLGLPIGEQPAGSKCLIAGQYDMTARDVSGDRRTSFGGNLWH
jgi:hypothetical protein